MQIKIPSEVKWIMKILEKHNYESYVVGGCVRDSLLQKTPQDWDLCTNCSVDEMTKIFQNEGKKVGTIGAKHGTVVVIVNDISFEITMYRIEKNYINHRRPEKVMFTERLEEDLRRRDFTINAMAYSPKEGLVDLFGGKKDLLAHCIRCVGDPQKRFPEDALRILRGVRFATELGFVIHSSTWKAMKKYVFTLDKISKERIRDEFIKILLSPSPSKGIQALYDIGALPFIIPELEDMVGFQQYTPYHHLDVFDHTLMVLDHTKPILIQRLAALLHDIGKLYTFTMDEEGTGHFYNHAVIGAEKAGKILRYLRFDNDTIDATMKLVREHMMISDTPTKKAIKRLIIRVGKENMENLFDLQEADNQGHAIKREKKGIEEARKLFQEIINEEEALTIKDLKINGNDLIQLGVPKGPKIKEILHLLLEEVLDENNKNHSSYLYKRTKELIDKDSYT